MSSHDRRKYGVFFCRAGAMLAIMTLCASGAHAIYAPLQNIQAAADEYSVQVRVYDPGDSQWHEESYPGDISNFRVASGTACWFNSMTHNVCYVVYDPAKRDWAQGETPVWGTPGNLSNASGVVAFLGDDTVVATTYDFNVGHWQTYTSFCFIFPEDTIGAPQNKDGVVTFYVRAPFFDETECTAWFMIYSPVRQVWQEDFYSASPADSMDLTTSQGVVAFQIRQTDDWGTTYDLGAAIYDPTRGSWRTYIAPLFDTAASNIRITSGTIVYEWWEGLEEVLAYDGMNWGSIQQTRMAPAASCAVAQPWGSPPFLAQFIDQSLYAVAWSWDFGDGSAASHDRSPQHTYDSEGVFTVALTATGFGGQTASASLLVSTRPEPTVCDQPQDQTVCEGDMVELPVGAIGAEPISYRWSHDGSPLTDGGTIAGATSQTLTIGPVSAADAGTYACEVSNSSGAEVSRASTLTVARTPVPPAVPFPSDQAFDVSTSPVLSWESDVYSEAYSVTVWSDDVTAPQIESHAVTITSRAVSTECVYATDLDGDGDVDVLSPHEVFGPMVWYQNNGSYPPTFTRQWIGTGDSADSTYAIDVDGDADVDVLYASSFHDEVGWYENDGGRPPAFARHGITTSAAGAKSVYAIDLDGDGDVDVLPACGNGIAWYENDGGSSPTFTSHSVTTWPLGARSVYAVDLDGDGDVDILSYPSQFDDTIAWYENDGGSPPAFSRHVITTSVSFEGSVYAIDLDGDGDMDVLSASEGDDTVAWYENDAGSPPAFTRHVIAASAEGAKSVYAIDLDGDGDMDVLSASFGDDTVAWYENDARLPPVFTRHVITTSADDANSVYAIDLDGDGDVDVLSGSSADRTIAWYENRPRPIVRTISALQQSECTLSEPLSPNVAYHWQVEAAGLCGDILGPVWTFRTWSQPPVLRVTPLATQTCSCACAVELDVQNAGGGDMNWMATVTAGETWLSITSGEAGVNEGIITVEYPANPESTSRQGTVRVEAPGVTGSPIDVTISQAGDDAFDAGDVNCTGAVDAVDVQLVINGALGLPMCGTADLNGDDDVNALDVQLAINTALGVS